MGAKPALSNPSVTSEPSVHRQLAVNVYKVSLAAVVPSSCLHCIRFAVSSSRYVPRVRHHLRRRQVYFHFSVPANPLLILTGGTAACVIAGRLTATDPSLKLLIIESGQHSRDVPRHVQPCRYVENIAPDSTTVSVHIGKPSAHLNGRRPVVQCGRSVGGGSAVNCKLFGSALHMAHPILGLDLCRGYSHVVRSRCCI